MASKKMKGARIGAKVGAKAVPVAGRAAGRVAWKAGKGEAKLIRRAMSAQQSRKSRYFKYGLFLLIGLAIGAAIARSRKNDGASSSYTGTTGQHAPDSGSPAGQRGETWGSGTPAGTAGGGGQQSPGDEPRTGAERDYSDPSSGPLIGEHHGPVEGVGEEQEELEQRIRTNIGEDPRTAEMPRVNVEVNDGVAELRGTAPSEDAKLAAGEIAQEVEGVREVRNLITVS
ncbi:MAG: BON domain-containing protein [Rubrobacteraceae bacterium]|nr:BON domain-containing protein [Rubrobacteraceae bacterium]